MTDELEAIRARHKTADARFVVQGITLDGAAVPRAHTDRATLLRLLDAAREELREVVKMSIPLDPSEMQSGYNRVQWAEGLIRQLPDDHEGRNSWLLNYGSPDDGQHQKKPALRVVQQDDPKGSEG